MKNLNPELSTLGLELTYAGFPVVTKGNELYIELKSRMVGVSEVDKAIEQITEEELEDTSFVTKRYGQGVIVSTK